MKTNKININNCFLFPTLITLLNLIPAGRVTAQTFTTLYSFTAGSTDASGVYTNSDGSYSLAGLITNASGNTLYGTAQRGGSSGNGTVFAVNTDGTGFTTLHSFSALRTNSSGAWTNSDGANPEGAVILSGNTLYGVAPFGGSSGNGTVFAVHTDGSGFTNLHSFTAAPSNGSCCRTNGDGVGPAAGLIVVGDTLFGAANSGGSSGRGTVFKLNTDGSGFTNLHSFTAPDPSTGFNSDGNTPNGLILSGNILYGTAYSGGSSGAGTVFKLNTNGTGFTTLHSLTDNPAAGLIILSNTLFGATVAGGSGGGGTVFALGTNGTGFTNLHNFTNNSSDGSFLRAGLVLRGNTLYGAAGVGGTSGIGTVYAVHTDGTGFAQLHSFSRSNNGASPVGGLILSGDSLYGMAYPRSSSVSGTVFRLSFRPQVAIAPSGILPSVLIISWPSHVAGFDYTGYRLQKANALTGPFADVPGSSSPYSIPITSAQQFYRLIQ